MDAQHPLARTPCYRHIQIQHTSLRPPRCDRAIVPSSPSPLHIIPAAVLVQAHTPKLSCAAQVVPENYIAGLEPAVLDTSSWRYDLAEDGDKVAVSVRLEDWDRGRLGLGFNGRNPRTRVRCLNWCRALLGRSTRLNSPRITVHPWLTRNIQSLAGYDFSMVEHKSMAVGRPLGLSGSAADGLLGRASRARSDNHVADSCSTAMTAQRLRQALARSR